MCSQIRWRRSSGREGPQVEKIRHKLLSWVLTVCWKLFSPAVIGNSHSLRANGPKKAFKCGDSHLVRNNHLLSITRQFRLVAGNIQLDKTSFCLKKILIVVEE